MNTISEIIPNLFISSYLEAHQFHLLKQSGITHIINLSSYKNPFPEDFVYKRIIIDDVPHAQLNRWFIETSFFIEQTLKHNGAVLVHCDAGVSRSVTVVLAFLIMNFEIPLALALQMVRNKRYVANPNPGFLAQLQTLEKILSIRTN